MEDASVLRRSPPRDPIRCISGHRETEHGDDVCSIASRIFLEPDIEKARDLEASLLRRLKWANTSVMVSMMYTFLAYFGVVIYRDYLGY